jgi:hypothetical protein
MSKNLIYGAILYGCETWSLTLREEACLRVFEKREKEVFLYSDAVSC